MIIIHVMGGLGNQLYQYALSEKLKSLGKTVKLDLYAYRQAQGEEREWRELELAWLEGPEYEVCTMQERTDFLDNSMKLPDRVRRKLFGRKNRTVEETKDYMPELYEMDDVYLYGFWGCDRYYVDILPLLQEKIRFPKSSNPLNERTIAHMEQEQSVSIHIRRKDYLTVADGRRYMGICTDAYYASAVHYIRNHIENPVFYIFSDDIDYARAHFADENMHIVDWNTGRESMYDMELMSRCKYNICANSTFSIWGARLNRYPRKLMLRPLHHDNYETTSVMEIKRNWQDWILMDSDGKVL
ncbi:MAG: alpha-1,2-fucosyltransferase [Lachnospiraceae bacterium]|nr:alpha-1,2-fucosyltransferase [Lachnospiraceae bacterium]